MLVVADASPLIFLGRLGLLDLLPSLYGRVLVPEAVFREATRGGENLPGSTAIRVADWIEVVPGESDPDLRQALEEQLDKGEAAAIALAQSVEADLLLIDERQGRRLARRMGLSVKGTLGVLVSARRDGLLSELKPILERLLHEGAWITEHLVRSALESVGEQQEED